MNMRVDAGFAFRVADLFMLSACNTAFGSLAPVLWVNSEDLITQGASLLRRSPPLVSVWRANPPMAAEEFRRNNSMVNLYLNRDTDENMKYRMVHYKANYSISHVSYSLSDANAFAGQASMVGLDSVFKTIIELPEVVEKYRFLFPSEAAATLRDSTTGMTSEMTGARLFETITQWEVLVCLPMLLTDDGEFAQYIELVLKVLDPHKDKEIIIGGNIPGKDYE